MYDLARPRSRSDDRAVTPAPGPAAWRPSALPLPRPAARFVILTYLLVALAAGVGAVYLKAAVEVLAPPEVYRKDFIQEYLLARAVVSGADPYLPLPELAEGLIELPPDTAFRHATPHPPPVAILSLPLALLSYEQAAVAWFGFEIVCLLVAVHWLLRGSGLRWPGASTMLISLLVVGWAPFWTELVVGQLMIPLLVLLVTAWLALRSGQTIRGGVLLGCIVALKLMAWPLVIWLAIRRSWAGVAAAGASMVGANVAAALLLGFDRVADYYLRVGPAVGALYRAEPNNFSAWSIGWRVFQGTGSERLLGVHVSPLVTWPAAAQAGSGLLPGAVLVIGLVLAARARGFDAAFGMLVCISTLVNPVAWSHYLTLAAVPIAISLRQLAALSWPKRETGALVAIGLLLNVAPVQLQRLALSLAGEAPVLHTAATVPFAFGLVTLIPLAATLGLVALIWHADRAGAGRWDCQPRGPLRRRGQQATA